MLKVLVRIEKYIIIIVLKENDNDIFRMRKRELKFIGHIMRNGDVENVILSGIVKVSEIG